MQFLCTIPQTGPYIPLPLLHQLWSTSWNKEQEMAQFVSQEGFMNRYSTRIRTKNVVINSLKTVTIDKSEKTAVADHQH